MYVIMNHNMKVRRVAGAMRDSNKIKFRRAGVSHQLPLARREQTGTEISVDDLTEILKINVKKQIATAESGCSFVQVVQETLKHGLVPLVVPELKTITLGGAISGCSVESMSYKVGGFHDTCLECEIITTEGEILTCNRQQNRELFEMVHGTFGTLGLVTAVTFRLTPAKPYVHLVYHQFDNLADFNRAIRHEYEKPTHDFMDGLIFSNQNFKLVMADFCDAAPYLSDYSGQKVFYKSVYEREEDYLRTEDYFFRYDRDCHWISRNYGLENPLLRATVGHWALGSTNMLKFGKKFAKVMNRNPDVTVDTMTSFQRFPELFEWYDQEIGAYPVWIVPYKIPKMYPWINPEFVEGDEKLYIDLATYGVPVPAGKNYYEMIDAELMKLHGIKTLISVNNYDEKTFWQIFNKKEYDKIKKRFDPQNKFPNLYHKVHRSKA